MLAPAMVYAAGAKPAALHSGSFPSGNVDGITDVAGVRVAHLTKISGSGALRPGIGPVRTGATAILQNRDPWTQRCAAAFYALNGNGEFTGTHWIEESGFIEHPILLTGTMNVPRVADGVESWMIQQYPDIGITEDVPLPVVGECDDQGMNDDQGRHVLATEIPPLLNRAGSGQFARGNVGAGTGMHGFSFKGGIGSASRVLPANLGGYTVGVLLNLNGGSRERLTIAGVPIGMIMRHELLPVVRSFRRRVGYLAGRGRIAGGSINVIVATDAPIDSHILHAMIQRVAFGLGKAGWSSLISSGDFVLGFSTTNLTRRNPGKQTETIDEDEHHIDALYSATADAAESAVYDALWSARTMVGADGWVLYGLPHPRVRALLAQYRR
ncbi:MAG TPA: P1 family peptidase [Candidatus Baltobacteraceae bacterium]|jgi:D-aminopeptidase